MENIENALEICSTPLENRNWDLVIGAKKNGHFQILKNRNGEMGEEISYPELIELLQPYRARTLVIEAQYQGTYSQKGLRSPDEQIAIGHNKTFEFGENEYVRLKLTNCGGINVEAKQFSSEMISCFLFQTQGLNNEWWRITSVRWIN